MFDPSKSYCQSAIACSILAVSACTSAPNDPTAAWSPQKIQSEALDERKAGNFAKAVELLEKLEGRAAGTPLAQQAQIDKAYAHFKAGENAQAQSTLDRFIKLHPSSPALDYAFYLKGLASFNDNLGLFGFLSRQELSERDQQAAKESFESFRELVVRFPDSKYSPDARLRMTYTVNSLAAHEVHVARYYHSRGAYVASVNRAQSALTEYPGTPAAEEALFLLFSSYNSLGMDILRDDSKRVLIQNFPESEFLSGSQMKTRNGPWWKLW